jgi:hypothetical protein
MLFNIENKETKQIESTGLTDFQVHYLFIDKKWGRDTCVIYDSAGHKMNYESFSKIYNL